MAEKISRRKFVVASTAGVAAAAAPANVFGALSSSKGVAPASGPTIMTKRSVKPVVVASANGHKFKNGGSMTCVEKAYSMIIGGSDVLDAVIAGVNIVELDPDETSVGYGGLPNADGVVQLDACCMHGPTKGAGGVAAIEGVKTPSLVAQKVMQKTTNLLLAGQGAQDFARRMGFDIVADLNTDKSRAAYRRWKAEAEKVRDLPDHEREQVLWKLMQQMARDRWIDGNHVYGTINCNGVNATGEISGVTTTSGLAFKIPGRVGDSPVLGAGLYVDGEIGAAGSTGLGEANLFNLTSFYIVECMRRGMHPKDAGMEGLNRIKAQTTARTQKKNGDPNFSINFYVLNAKGEHAGVSMYGGEHIRYAVCDEDGARTIACDPLLQGAPTE